MMVVVVVVVMEGVGSGGVCGGVSLVVLMMAEGMVVIVEVLG